MAEKEIKEMDPGKFSKKIQGIKITRAPLKKTFLS